MSVVPAGFDSPYLARENAFPLDASGTPWGEATFRLRVAQKVITWRGLSRAQKETLRSLWNDFHVEVPATHSLDVAVFRAPESDFSDPTRPGWTYHIDFDYGESSVRMVGHGFMGRLDWRRAPKATLWTMARSPDEVRSVFENFLRVLLAYALVERGGVMLHSAVVVERDEARLFYGPSGAGKSTVARLALRSRRSVASDDLNPVIPSEERTEAFVACGAPFVGEVGTRSNRHYPLAAICRLEKGTRDELRSMGEAETLASLLACAPFLNRDPHRTPVLLRAAETLARAVPAYVLTFRREGTFWPLLHGAEKAAS